MTSSHPTLPLPPLFVRVCTVLSGLALAATVAPGVWLTGIHSTPVLWFACGFELMVLGAAVIAVLAGIGRFRQAWGLALACAAGTILVAAVFGRVQVTANFGPHPVYGPWIIRIFLLRLALCGTLALLASVAVFSRNPRSWGAFARACLVLLPVAAVGVWFVAKGAPGAGANPSPGADAVRILVVCLGGLIVIALVSVGGHLIIRAFEHGRLDDAPPAGHPGSPDA